MKICTRSLNEGILIFCFVTLFFFFNDTATTEIYTLSLHDALPISAVVQLDLLGDHGAQDVDLERPVLERDVPRSEEHTSELQSRQYLVCRLLLEKKKDPVRRSHQHSY